MKILLAGPGTGKTSNIKNIIAKHGNGSKFLILSFTNATVKDLRVSLTELGISENNCMTLHKFAVKFNHDSSRHVLQNIEIDQLETISKGLGIEFNDLCNFLSSTTFDQMIERFVSYAKSNHLYLKDKLSQYDSLIIDEYQDFNPNEQALIDILISQINTSYILGDDDQCIYNFKDASSDKIISFYQDAKNEKLDHQHICYRCPDKVVEHATNLIKNNKKRIDKKWLKNGNQGDIKYSQLRTFNDVADAIYNEIIKVRDEKILILTPVGFAIKPLIDKLTDKNVEFTNHFLKKTPDEIIIKSWKIKCIFGKFKYLNLVLLSYILLNNRKKFYATLKNHFDNGENYTDLFKLIENKMPPELKNNQKDLINFLSEESYKDILSLYEEAKGFTENEKLENIFKEINFEDVKNIEVMSIHKSKGLGANFVFIVGLIEGIIPNQKKGNDSIESQRRLLYVGMTRAKKQLFLFSNLNVEGKNVHTVNKDDFKYDFSSKMYIGKASTFLTELKLK
jgi:DNA helicase-2/ATP-dependent DNA helicase PcrA